MWYGVKRAKKTIIPITNINQQKLYKWKKDNLALMVIAAVAVVSATATILQKTTARVMNHDSMPMPMKDNTNGRWQCENGSNHYLLLLIPLFQTFYEINGWQITWRLKNVRWLTKNENRSGCSPRKMVDVMKGFDKSLLSADQKKSIWYWSRPERTCRTHFEKQNWTSTGAFVMMSKDM